MPNRVTTHRADSSLRSWPPNLLLVLALLLVMCWALGFPSVTPVSSAPAPVPGPQEGGGASPKTEAEILLTAALPFAQKMLADHGEFFPYGYAMTRDKRVVQVAADPGKKEHPRSQSVLDFLEVAMRHGAQTGEYRASAVVVDVRVARPGSAQKTDAVEVRLEHSGGYCANVYLPYSKATRSPIQFGDLFATKRNGSIFRACHAQ